VNTVCWATQRLVEADAVGLHHVADGFQRGERAVSFVQVINAGRDAQGLQCPRAADPQHQLLADARAVVASVKPAGQVAVFGAVAVDVAVEQVQADSADLHQPDLRHQLAGAGVDGNVNRLAVRPHGRHHRHILDLGVEVVL
jgi:hypothetical protein